MKIRVNQPLHPLPADHQILKAQVKYMTRHSENKDNTRWMTILGTHKVNTQCKINSLVELKIQASNLG